jgi:signal transduction histidine kinase
MALGLATLAATVQLWSSQEWLPAGLRAATLAAPPLAVATTAGVTLLWPGRRARSVSAYSLLVGLAGVACCFLLLGYDPFDQPGCRQVCVQVTPLLDGVLETRTAVAVALLLSAVTGVIGAGLVTTGLRSARSGLLGAVVLAALAAFVALSGLRWTTFDEIAPSVVWLPLEPLVVGTVGVAASLLHLRVVRVRSSVERLVAGLSPDSVLTGAVLDVQFAFPGEDRWLDPTGNDADRVPAPDRCVVLREDTEPVVRLVLGRKVDPAEVLAGLAPSTLLALRNARLSAVALARLAEVQASQRRVVAASDGERRRIERDLHDGAQQRLVGAGLQLRVALSGVGSDGAEGIEQADAKVREALTRLRRLAHGVFPGVLADEGLEAALDELVMASDVPAELDTRIGDIQAAEVEMAAYATVAAVLGSLPQPAAATRCRIEVRQEAATLTVAVEMEPGDAAVRPLDLTAIGDRVGAVGGELRTGTTATGGSLVTAVIPCGS